MRLDCEYPIDTQNEQSSTLRLRRKKMVGDRVTTGLHWIVYRVLGKEEIRIQWDTRGAAWKKERNRMRRT